MKILYVVHQFFPECHSGTEQYCLAVAKEARRRGHDVTILSLEPIHDRIDRPFEVLEQDYDGFRVPRLRHWEGLQPNPVLRDYENPLVAAWFREFVRELGPDVVHIFHLRFLGSDLLDTLSRDLRVRSVVHLMDFWFLCPRFTLLRADGTVCDGPPDGGKGCVPCAYPDLADLEVEDAAKTTPRLGSSPSGANSASQLGALLRRPRVQLERLARADAIVAPSKFLASMFVRNGLAPDKLHVIPYGLEAGRVQRRDRRAAGGGERRPLQLAFAGVLSPWKAPHLCVDAMALAPDLDATMTIWGRTEEGMFQDYIDTMRARAADDPRVRFPGAFDESMRDDVLAGIDLLVVPSVWYENTPFVVLEAFAAGVPVAVSDLGGMTEIVEHDHNGFVFESGSADSLSRVLRRCVEDPEHLRSLSPQAPSGTDVDLDRLEPLYGVRAPNNSEIARS